MHPDYVNIGTPAMRIVEECGEILQCVGKGERFGWDSKYPNDHAPTAYENLESELLDLMLAIVDLGKYLKKGD